MTTWSQTLLLMLCCLTKAKSVKRRERGAPRAPAQGALFLKGGGKAMASSSRGVQLQRTRPIRPLVSVATP